MFRVTIEEFSKDDTPISNSGVWTERYQQTVDAPLDEKRTKRMIDAVNYSPRVRNRGKKESTDQ
jgi:hypothetical protein